MTSFLGIFIVLLVLGIPISLALGTGGILYLWLTDNWMLVQAMPQRMLASNARKLVMG